MLKIASVGQEATINQGWHPQKALCLTKTAKTVCISKYRKMTSR